MKWRYLIITILAAFVLFNNSAMAEKMDTFYIYGKGKKSEWPRISFKFPAWFKTSFYDLNEDLNDAREAGKRGIMVIFSQENCNHCLAFIKATLGDPDVKKRLSKNFDVIGMDIFNDLEVTDIDGSVTPIKDFAVKHRAYTTPTIMFYGIENARLVKIVGFYPPEKFLSVLDYIDGGYYRTTRLSQYFRDIQNTKTAAIPVNYSLKHDALFLKDKYDLQSVRRNNNRPTLVLFEKPDCTACKRFHERVMTIDKVRAKMKYFNIVQLDATDDKNRIITPSGQQITPRQWFDVLDLRYDIASVFFDENGKEVYRNDAEVGRSRMLFSMQFVLDKGYLEIEQVQRWNRSRVLKKISNRKNNLTN